MKVMLTRSVMHEVENGKRFQRTKVLASYGRVITDVYKSKSSANSSWRPNSWPWAPV